MVMMTALEVSGSTLEAYSDHITHYISRLACPATLSIDLCFIHDCFCARISQFLAQWNPVQS